MTREEFEEAVDAIVYELIEEYHKNWQSDIDDIIQQRWQKPLPDVDPENQRYYSRDKRQDVLKQNALLHKWVTGGVEGGNCWNSSSNSFTNSDPKPAFALLDRVIERLAPDLLYRDWLKLQEKINRGNWTKREYYGNHENFEYEWIAIDELYGFFNECKVLPPSLGIKL